MIIYACLLRKKVVWNPKCFKIKLLLPSESCGGTGAVAKREAMAATAAGTAAALWSHVT